MTDAAHTASAARDAFDALFSDLYGKSGGKNYGISLQDFAGILLAISAKYFPAGASNGDFRNLYLSLHVEELTLARACAAGNEHAWQDFMIRYREKLHDAALAITRDDSRARELAGSIYADLYGTGNREGKRISKLSYYNGRGSLEGWLRTVLAQCHVNEYRSGRHAVSLEEEHEAGRQFAAPDPPAAVEADPRLCSATDAALAALPAEDRCILAYYFLDDLTLAKIAGILGVHESTISRRLEKSVRALRKDIVLRLTRQGMSRRQAEEALDVDVRDMTIDIRGRLTQDSDNEPFSKQRAIRAGEGQE
jgi:RNA polymerase sigma-70 factor (ECF subfamily)